MTEETKVCNDLDCKHSGVPQPLDNFYKHSQSKGGRVNQCKDCRNAYQRRRHAKGSGRSIKPMMQAMAQYKQPTDHKEVVALLVAEKEFHLERAARCDAAIAALNRR